MPAKNVVEVNFLLTEHEDHTREYRYKVVPVQTERSDVYTKTTKSQYSTEQFDQVDLTYQPHTGYKHERIN